MAYDSPEFAARHMIGPVLCTVAAGVKLTAAVGTQVGTSSFTNDRIRFFRNVKITGFRVRTRSGAAANAHALTLGRPTAKLLHGTVTLATALLGTVAGVDATGGLCVTNTNLQLVASDSLTLVYKMANGASIGTHTILTAVAQSYDAFIEYQDKF